MKRKQEHTRSPHVVRGRQFRLSWRCCECSGSILPNASLDPTSIPKHDSIESSVGKSETGNAEWRC
jgi:hypothetical protein